MTLRTNTVSAGVYLSDTYIAANYPGGDAAVIADIQGRMRTIATNRGWTINESTWVTFTRRTLLQGGIEYFVFGDYGDPSDGVRYRVGCQATKDIP